MANYWTDETNSAIHSYKNSTDDRERNRIFNEKLYQPMLKLSEYLINTMSTDYLPFSKRAQQEWLISKTLSKFHLIDSDSNPFAYCQVTMRNFIIRENNTNYEEYKRKFPMDAYETFDIEDEEDINNDEHKQWYKDFLDQSYNYFIENGDDLFKKETYKKVFEQMYKLLYNKDMLGVQDMHKYIVIYLIDATGYSRSIVHDKLNSLKPPMRRMWENYLNSGDILGVHKEDIPIVRKPSEFLATKPPKEKFLRDYYDKGPEWCKQHYKLKNINYAYRIKSWYEYIELYPEEE